MCTPDHSPNWRPLHPAELVQATDRCWDWQSREWSLVPEWCVGMFRLERWKPRVSAGW